MTTPLKNIFKLLRVHQWIKNSFVLAGIIFGHAWGNTQLVISAGMTLLAFCFISSCVYIYNDMQDITNDRAHPYKKNRPLAAAQISLLTAATISILLFNFALILGMLVSQLMMFFLLGYFVLNLAYTHYLKNIVIIDVFAISAGFMLRLLAGTIGLNILPSPWLLLCGLSVTLFLGFAKRRAEIILCTAHFSETVVYRKVLQQYTPLFLDKMIGITASCSILSYALYTMNPETIRVHHTANLIYTVPFVIYGIFRYLFLLHDKKFSTGEDTAKDFFTDPHLLITGIGWLGLLLYLLY